VGRQGLNDATRNQNSPSGTAPSDYTFGGILVLRNQYPCSIYRTGTRMFLELIRLQGAHDGNLCLRNGYSGWAFVVSAGKRYADEGYFERPMTVKRKRTKTPTTFTK
jgi:hypothetical protein